jgi:hypothetical protein
MSQLQTIEKTPFRTLVPILRNGMQQGLAGELCRYESISTKLVDSIFQATY